MKQKLLLLAAATIVCFVAVNYASAQTNGNARTETKPTTEASFSPYDLRVEYMKSPIGIDESKPRFSWKIKSSDNDGAQSAYRIAVTTPSVNDPVWDSGKVESTKMVAIEYAGPQLKPETEYFWSVTVWTKTGLRASTVQSRFTTGIGEWKAKWIGLEDDPNDKPNVKLDGIKWIWPENTQSAPVVKAAFRKKFEIEDKIASADIAFAADNGYKLFVNGKEIGSGTNFKAAQMYDVKNTLLAGSNTIAVEVSNFGESPNPAGLIGVLHVVYENGKELIVQTDKTWNSEYGVKSGFHEKTFDDSDWKPACEIATHGDGPWGEVKVGADRISLPARYLKKPFTPEGGTIKRATAYISGLGYYELYLNGKKVGDHVLDPVLTDYDKRVPYATYEIDPKSFNTRHNAIRVILGNGRYYAPRLTDPTTTRTFGNPKLLFQMVIEYTNGKKQVIASDESWRITTEGPIRDNNDYDGEIYDARKEIPDYDDLDINKVLSPYYKLFKDVQLVEAPKGKLVSQMMPPMRITEEIKPKSVTEIRPGVWVYDFGQNFVGWCRLKVKGPVGSEVMLRHAETLQTDGDEKGMLYVANLRGAKCRDIYILKGMFGSEVYEPRFTYHGFRYAELTGFPGKPDLDTLTGCVVGTDLPIVGSFECSNPLINKIYKNIEWGIRGNYLSIPTDCPQRDERQGWQGDRAGEALGEMYIFDNATLYSKWMIDIEDSQREDGNVSDVCPNFWPLYGSNVTWPSAFIIIPNSLQQMYGDDRPIKLHYEAMKKWMAHIATFIREDGTLDKDNYGDWCVPPEKPEMIHSQDPARKTVPGILATSYYIKDLQLMAQFAEMLGKESEAAEFNKRANEMTVAFNKRFYNAEKGQYDNGTQTSCVLPLAFGLVPSEDEEKVFQTLVKNIENVTDNHIGTGLVGGQWLNNVLKRYGRNDIAYKFVSNNDYPSWGYMVENGATTIWELWNGNTADPAMNSGNHVMLVGDLVIWLYQNVAGIPAIENAQNGKLIYMPQPGGGLTYAKASYDSIYGMIMSSWVIEDSKFKYDVTVPVGQQGFIILPVSSVDSVQVTKGKAITIAAETSADQKKKYVKIQVSSGDYSFECDYEE